ncbi:hypothetical protein BDR03DRAFT_1018228 [Suillus americanus]|nr:hypothetical protein BDR03DRAFT_1018228 [Suillus americanus]
MSAFSMLHHLLLLHTPNVLAALLLDVDATMPHPALTSILVCPVTQPEVLKLKQLENGVITLIGLCGDRMGLYKYPDQHPEATFDCPEHCYFGYWQLILLPPLVLLQYKGL